MAANENLQPQQLKMFMTANEIAESYVPDWEDVRNSDRQQALGSIPIADKKRMNKHEKNERLRDATYQAVGARKAQEAYSGNHSWLDKASGQVTTLADEITRNGVMYPIQLVNQPNGPDAPFAKKDDPSTVGVVANGHHRLAVQATIDPDRLMPVEHNESKRDIKRWYNNVPEGSALRNIQ